MARVKYDVRGVGTRKHMSAEYEDYMVSEEWAAKRRRVLIRDDYTCQRCGKQDYSGGKLHVHHMKYFERLFGEGIKHLQTLCVSCHVWVGGDS
jgi:5-methylcytosine-specific restriction endonuclease McrA